LNTFLFFWLLLRNAEVHGTSVILSIQNPKNVFKFILFINFQFEWTHSLNFKGDIWKRSIVVASNLSKSYCWL